MANNSLKGLAMAKSKKTIPESTKRNIDTVFLAPKAGESDEAFVARNCLRPVLQAGTIVRSYNKQKDGVGPDVVSLVAELEKQCEVIHGGNLNRVEAMLLVQAHSLDAIFGNLARSAKSQEYLPQFETFLRLALKAQGQCRATLETLAAIKNPPMIFAKQANIAHGPQQVNNGIPLRAREIENLQNKQSGGDNELLPDTGTPALAGRIDSAVEAVGAINRAEVKSG